MRWSSRIPPFVGHVTSLLAEWFIGWFRNQLQRFLYLLKATVATPGILERRPLPSPII